MANTGSVFFAACLKNSRRFWILSFSFMAIIVSVYIVGKCN